jgi:UDP-2,3-diacylglucosamine pyrophosphatase LpxH
MEINPSGSDMSNNLDTATFSDLLKQIATGITNGTVPTPEFIIFLGDMVGNYLNPNITTEENAVFTNLKTTFPNTPIFYTFGNHDSTAGINEPFYSTISSYNSPYQIAQANN